MHSVRLRTKVRGGSITGTVEVTSGSVEVVTFMVIYKSKGNYYLYKYATMYTHRRTHHIEFLPVLTVIYIYMLYIHSFEVHVYIIMTLESHLVPIQ